MDKRHLEVFLEFLIFGVVMGVAEDVITIKLATGEPITWKIIGIIVLVAIPFAAIGELIVDRRDLLTFFKKGKSSGLK